MRLTRRFSSLLILPLAASLVTACPTSPTPQQLDGGNLKPTPPKVDPKLTLAPSTTQVRTGETQAFAAALAGLTTGADTTVEWKVEEAQGGSVDEKGIYTAPAHEGVYHVVATSKAAPAATQTATVTVTESKSAVSLVPASVSLLGGAQQTFLAQVTGAEGAAIRWSVEENSGGSVDEHGVYTAPVGAGEYHVRATSSLDGTVYAVASVHVSPTAISITPSALTLLQGDTQAFQATVTGNVNESVTWRVYESGGGTVTAEGVYTAPSTAGTFHVVATSVADGYRYAAATVTVGTVGVKVSPASATVLQGGKLQLQAPVTRSSNTSVTWSMVEKTGGGSVSKTGQYFAPYHAGTFHVRATSAAQPEAYAQATVQVPEVLITGKQELHHAYQSQDTVTAVDLSQAPIQAWQETTADGGTAYVKYSGTGKTDGTFSVPNVPPGAYFITLDGRSFRRFTTRSVDLSRYEMGRPDVVPVPVSSDGGTSIRLNVTHVSPWNSWDGDTLQITSEGAGLGYGDLSFLPDFHPADGTTGFDYTIDYGRFTLRVGNGGLIDASKGDVTFLGHLSGIPAQNGVYAAALTEAFSTSQFTLPKNGSPELSVAFQPLEKSTFTTTFPRGSYVDNVTRVHPSGFSSNAYAYLDAQPGGTAHGRISGAPDLYTAYITPGTTPVTLSADYGNPYPNWWGLFGEMGQSYLVSQPLITPSGATANVSLYADIYRDDLAAAFSSQGFGVTLSPPATPKLNGADAFTKRAGVGTTPKFTWDDPVIGSATGFSFELYALTFSATQGSWTRSLVWTASGDGFFRSLTLPQGLLTPGAWYVARITASSEPNSKAGQPNISSFPSSRAQLVTGLFTP